MTKERNYRIDFLRALSMLLIVVQHYVVWGIKPSQHAVFHVDGLYSFCDYTSMEALYLLSCIGVNCFVMITGYFMINRYEYRWKALMKLWLTTAFYSVVLYIISSYLGSGFNTKKFLPCFAPVWSYQYWFITKYIGLMLIAPFLSVMATKISQTSYKVLLSILFCLCFMIPYGNIFAGGQSVMWLTFVYLSAGYIRLYGVPNKIINNIKLISFAILSVYTFAIVGFEYAFHTDFGNMLGSYQLHSFASDSPIFFLSLAIFIWTLRKTTTNPNIILRTCVKAAPFILAVYLIHMNKNLYVYIWKVIIPDTFHIPVTLHALLSCFAIFVLCIGVDYLRMWLFRLLMINKLIDKLSSRITFEKITIK